MLDDKTIIKSIFDAVNLLFNARTEIINRADGFLWFLRWPKARRQAEKLRRAQMHLVDELDLGGWNCFRD